MAKELSDQDFQEVVLNSKLPVLVNFWAPWCGPPCIRVSPLIEKLSHHYGDKFDFCEVDIDAAPKTALSYRIVCIPTLVIFKSGKKIDQLVGAVTESTIKSKMDALLQKTRTLLERR
jgi:thioredoxin 1